MAPAQFRHVAPAAEGADPTGTHLIRDRIAARLQRADQRYPEALDLEARILDRMHVEICGHASTLAGTHPPQHFRDMLLGGRAVPLTDLCRLALSHRPEARAAVFSAVAALAEAIGYRLEPSSAPALSLGEASARFARESADVGAAIHRARDEAGRLDTEALERIARELDESDHAAAQLRAVLAEARRTG